MGLDIDAADAANLEGRVAGVTYDIDNPEPPVTLLMTGQKLEAGMSAVFCCRSATSRGSVLILNGNGSEADVSIVTSAVL